MIASLLAHLLLAQFEPELEDLQGLIAKEKAAWSWLKKHQTNTLDWLDQLERLSQDAEQNQKRLESALGKTDRLLLQTDQSVAALQQTLDARRAQMQPRLRVLHRLARRSGLAAYLRSTDFAAAVKVERSLERLIASEARAAASFVLLESHLGRQKTRLERLRQHQKNLLRQLAQEKHSAAQTRAQFDDLLNALSAKARFQDRVLKDLAEEERQLQRRLRDMESDRDAEGFRSLRGHLPYPVDGVIEAGFGKVVNPKFDTVTIHKGIDFRAPKGSPVHAVAAGTVAFVGWLKGYGHVVILDHGGEYHSLSAHLETVLVETGQSVSTRTVVGTVGDTGSLKGVVLYFEMRKDGEAFDPLPWLGEP